MNKKVIYTATFPHKNNMDYFLFEPEIIPEGYDFVCFTNNTNFKSDVWDIRIVPSLYTDGARDAKRYKTLPQENKKLKQQVLELELSPNPGSKYLEAQANWDASNK